MWRLEEKRKISAQYLRKQAEKQPVTVGVNIVVVVFDTKEVIFS